MRARRLTPDEVAHTDPAELAGSVIVASLQVQGQLIEKGTRVDNALARSLVTAAAKGRLSSELRLVWPDADEMHEDVAGEKLSLAVGGAGVDQRPPRQAQQPRTAANRSPGDTVRRADTRNSRRCPRGP